MLRAVENKPEEFQFASEELRADDEIFQIVLEKNGAIALQFTTNPRVRSDRSIVLHAVKSNSRAINFMDEIFRDDLEIMTFALARLSIFDHGFLSIASNRLKRNPDFVLQVLKEHPKEFTHVAEDLQNDPVFMLRALQMNTELFHLVEIFLTLLK